jgi:sortase A
MILSAGVWLFYNEQADERAGREAQQALTQLVAEINGAGTDGQTGETVATVTPVQTASADAALVAAQAGADGATEAETAGAEAAADTQGTAGETDADLSQDDEMPGLTIDGHTYIGFVTVPEIGLALPIQRDYDFDLLDISPVRFRGSLKEGDLIIAGHNFKTHFSPLKNVSLGSDVTFTDVNGVEYDYIVSKIETIAGYDYSGMLSDSDEWDLTLFTCTKGGKNRLTLRCVQTGRQSAKAFR